jgi:hypothetical protein
MVETLKKEYHRQTSMPSSVTAATPTLMPWVFHRHGRGLEQLYDLTIDPLKRVNLMASAIGERRVGAFRMVPVKLLTDKPGSAEVETAYIGNYKKCPISSTGHEKFVRPDRLCSGLQHQEGPESPGRWVPKSPESPGRWVTESPDKLGV